MMETILIVLTTAIIAFYLGSTTIVVNGKKIKSEKFAIEHYQLRDFYVVVNRKGLYLEESATGLYGFNSHIMDDILFAKQFKTEEEAMTAIKAYKQQVYKENVIRKGVE